MSLAIALEMSLLGAALMNALIKVLLLHYSYHIRT